MMIGTTLAHYKITAKLGQGGMGEVYRATDQKLEREVALKVLPSEMASSPERLERFRREAKALAALDHPGIVSVFSVEEADGVHFLTMQLVEGQSLDQVISEGGLPLETLLDYATALADALAAAHEKEIVHRDLKPGNIIVSEGGRLKVLDFGLVKMTAPQDEKLADSEVPTEVQTREGVVMGTVPYMSPEQLSGRTVDHRTDIFSLGILLYEMAAGRRPFEGSSSVELASSILRDPPPPLGRVRKDLPAEFGGIVSRCLEKDARDRFQTAREAENGLKALHRGVASGVGRTAGGGSQVVPEQRPPTSIAVLPFSDMSPARDQDWFCEGIAEEILNALTKLPGLRVATRTSAFRFKDQARHMGKIGEALGVTTLLEGSVRTAGSRLRVTAQLVNASDGYQLWSERFDRQMVDVFQIQDEIAKKVVEALELRLVASTGGPRQAQHSDDLEAYQLFLKGRHFRYTKHNLKSALRYFEGAVERDSSYALARVALAETLVILIFYGMIPPSEGQARAKEEIRKARAGGGESAQALGIEGLLTLIYDWDGRAALESLHRAIELDPSYVPARAWNAWALVACGRKKEGTEQARQLQELDTQSPWANAMAGLVYLMAGDGEKALTYESRAVEIEPESVQAIYMLGLARAARSDWEDAEGLFSQAVERSSRSPWFVGVLAWCQAASGRHQQARRTLAELEARSKSEYVAPAFLAWGYSELGDLERARERLQEAFDERASVLTLMQIPPFRRLREEPFMEDLQRRLLGAGGTDSVRTE